MFGNGRPLTRRQAVRFMVAMTLLAWATQTLLSQWGFGADVATNRAIAIEGGRVEGVAAEEPKFMAPRTAAAAAPGGTLELRGEATVVGSEVRLKHIARWSNRDAAFFQEAGELVIERLDQRRPYSAIDLDLVRKTLADAGVKVAMVKFAGPMRCTVKRSDTKPDPEAALSKWIEAAERPATPTASSMTPAATAPLPPPAANIQHSTAGVSASPAADQSVSVRPAVRHLREILGDELSTRLGVPVEQLQINFRAQDERILNLCEPQFRFNVESSRSRMLGDTTWNVTVTAVAETGAGSQKAAIAASVRAWQLQTIVDRPIGARAPIGKSDVTERRTLVDRLPDEPLLSIDQVVGQQAARELKPGTVLTSRMIEAVPMARTNDLITVSLGQGSVRVKTVARAMEGGARGQRIRVKNETTNQVFDVVLTGPQEAVMGDTIATARASR